MQVVLHIRLWLHHGGAKVWYEGLLAPRTNYTQFLCCLCIATLQYWVCYYHCMPLSSELLYSKAGTSIETSTVVLLIEVAIYKAGTLLHGFLEGYPLRVWTWYCEVAIYKLGLELFSKVPFIIEIVVLQQLKLLYTRAGTLWFPWRIVSLYSGAAVIVVAIYILHRTENFVLQRKNLCTVLICSLSKCPFAITLMCST